MRAALAAILLLSAPAALAQGITQGFTQDGTPYGQTDTPPDPLRESAVTGVAGNRAVLAAPAAALRGLDTLDGAVTDFAIGAGQVASYERLTVSLAACFYPEDNPEGEAYAFLEIRDRRDGTQYFSGWMIASSPALSALDHPRYDVWVLNCRTE